MGTPDFAVPALRALMDGPHEVIAVYSQPPRPKGRGQAVQPAPVHAEAAARGIPVFTPKSLRRDAAARADFIALGADVAVVAAYGLLLPKEVLEAPRFGCLNIHASLLPRWRGASPIQHAVWKGDAESGVCIMQMDEGLDTGAVVARDVVPVGPRMTAAQLHDALAASGAALAARVLDGIAAHGRPQAVPQDGAGVTYAPLLTREHGRVDWTAEADEIDRQVRALNPWPGVWTRDAQGRRIKILAAEPVKESAARDGVSGGHHGVAAEAPGTLLDRGGLVRCGGGTVLRLARVQPENAKAMDAVSAVNGGYLVPGAAFVA